METFRFKFISVCFCFCSEYSFGQTVLYTSGIDMTISSNCNVYVDGNVVNDVQGLIHNNGTIYLTNDWTNNEPSGCLDPTAGTVILFGNAQFIQGSQTTTFNNLDLQGNGVKTLNINTIVGGNAGVLSLNNNIIDLNSNTLIITNPLPSAVTRTSGYILSETNPAAGYGTVEWRMGNSTAGNNYIYPFGTFSGDTIPFHFNVAAAGTQTTSGNISVATYPTAANASPNNLPLPTGVSDLNNPATGNDNSLLCLDRFWIIDANNYAANPSADLIFSYRDTEWNTANASTNTILEDSLRAWRWSGSQWQNPPIGTDIASLNKVFVSGVNVFSPWTLTSKEPVCGTFFLPNAFSPNSDNENDFLRIYFGDKDCVKELSFVLFDRWGEKVFETNDPYFQWDGIYKEKTMSSSVLVYHLAATLSDKTVIKKKGNISLLR